MQKGSDRDREKEKEREGASKKPQSLIVFWFLSTPELLFHFSHWHSEPGKAIIVAKLVDNLRQAAGSSSSSNVPGCRPSEQRVQEQEQCSRIVIRHQARSVLKINSWIVL